MNKSAGSENGPAHYPIREVAAMKELKRDELAGSVGHHVRVLKPDGGAPSGMEGVLETAGEFVRVKGVGWLLRDMYGITWALEDLERSAG